LRQNPIWQSRVGCRMPVDRARRDAATDALTSFLRGEADRDALEAVFERLAQAGTAQGGEGSGGDNYLEELLASWFYFGDRYRPVTEETWMAMCRHLAFLKTDLEERRWHDHGHGHEDEDRPRQILLARWHTLGLLVAFDVAYLTAWWLFVAATVISNVVYQVSLRKHDLLKAEERRKELKRRLEYHPFADQAEWLAHKHIVDEYHLPAYKNGAFGEPPSVRKWPARSAVPARWARYCFVAAMFACICLVSVALWPVWLVMMSLCSRNTSQPQQTTSGR
jgi:hypothetical protein